MPLVHTLGGIALSAEHIWIDEFDWQSVERSSDYSITGALLIDEAAKQAGRPITLEGQNDQGWVERQTLLDLYDLAAMAGARHALELADGRTFNVTFRPGESAITAKPLIRLAVPTSTAKYIVTLRLTEV